MFTGYDNFSAAERQLGEQIFQNAMRIYIADKGYANLPWKPHNVAGHLARNATY